MIYNSVYDVIYLCKLDVFISICKLTFNLNVFCFPLCYFRLISFVVSISMHIES